MGAIRTLDRVKAFWARTATGFETFAAGFSAGPWALREIRPTEVSSVRATTWRATLGDCSWFLRITVMALFPAGKLGS